VQLALGQEVGELKGAEVTLLLVEAGRMLLQQHSPAGLVVELEIVCVSGPVVLQKAPPTYAIELAVGHAVGGNQTAELGEQVEREGLIAAGAFCLGDEAKEPLRIASGECSHVTKDTSIPVWTPPAAG
jgi:hypothetical protein